MKPRKSLPPRRKLEKQPNPKTLTTRHQAPNRSLKSGDIAVIGMACRFPGAADYHGYWKIMVDGRDCIGEIPSQRWDVDTFYSAEMVATDKSVSRWCGLLEDVDQFDHRFFNISPREAKAMDPQQRLLLEETWHCIEDAGLSLTRLQTQVTSVHIGVMASDYQQISSSSEYVTDSYAALGGYDCILANRLSYIFGFSGASSAISAACASSLVAIHEAKTTLLNGHADFAIAGGVSLNLHPWKNISFSKSRMLSPDGRCKTFDKDANGYVPGDGVGVLLLQPLEMALAQGNPIHGIIKGSSVNHGGRAQSMTAPNEASQRRVIQAAYADADLSPETVTYVEAHGTGTSLGDPIEVGALTRAFQSFTTRKHYCHLGSVKTNIGHLEAAAGVAGVIKILMMMKHRQIPKLLHFKTVNPILNLANSPFKLATHREPWLPAQEEHGEAHPLRASVSSFGFGGTNTHAVIEAFDQQEPEQVGQVQKQHFFLISARNPKSLNDLQQKWAAFSQSPSYEKLNLADICGTQARGRERYDYRAGTQVDSKEGLIQFLRTPPDGRAQPGCAEWWLEVGPCQWQGGGGLKALHDSEHFLHQAFQKMKMAWKNSGLSRRLANGFRRAKWSEKNRALFQFSASNCLAQSLVDLNFEPEGITASGNGWWVVLAQTGMLTPEACLLAISSGNLPKTLQRPNRRIFDPISKTFIQPNHFDVTYLTALTRDLQLGETEVANSIQKARLLMNNQFTFKRHMEAWQAVLVAPLPSLTELLFDDSLLRPKADPSLRLLLLTMIHASLTRLYRKWHLPSEEGIEDPRFLELVDLVVDQVMTCEMLVAYLCDPSPNLEAIASELNSRQSRLNGDRPYLHLKSGNTACAAIEDAPDWLGKVLAMKRPPLPPVEAAIHLTTEPQTFTSRTSSPVIIQANLAENIGETWGQWVIAAWQRGAPLAMGNLYPAGSFKSQPLPTYAFDRRSFWLEPKTQDQPLAVTTPAAPPDHNGQEPFNKSNAKASLPVRDTDKSLQKDPKDPMRFSRTVSRRDDMIIRDTVVLGHDIVPSTLRLEMALSAARTVTGQKINCLANLLFENPGIVLGEYLIEVQIDANASRFKVTSSPGSLCQGRFACETLAPEPKLDLKTLCQGETVEREVVYRNYVAWGYHYGPSLQLIERIYDNGTAFIAQLGTVPVKEGKQTGLDPHLLDCVFQSVFWAAQQIGQVFKDGQLFVPFTVKSLKIYDSYNQASFVVMTKEGFRILKNGDLCLDYKVYDGQGELRVAIDTMLFKRVDRQFLDQSLKRQTQVAPMPWRQPITEYATRQREELVALEKGMGEVEAFGRLRLLDTLRQNGHFLEPGQQFSPGELKTKFGLIPKYERLFAALLEMWTRQGWLQDEGERLTVSENIQSSELQADLSSLGERKQRIGETWPDMEPFLNLIDVAVRHYPQVLSGEKTHLEVLFPKGSGTLFENIYKGNALSDFYNSCVTKAIIARIEYLLSQKPGRQVQILEIGAGTGGTSTMVLDAIKGFGKNLTYVYTDIGLGFVNFGKRTFAKTYPFTQFKVLDIAKDIQKQKFDPQSFDIVFETNCIHAVANLDRTTSEIKKLLRKDGLVIINEISQRQDFWTLVAGLIDGWWLFEDESRRIPHSPLLGYSGWQGLFQEHGFGDFYAVEPDREKVYEQAVLLGHSDGEVMLAAETAEQPSANKAVSGALTTGSDSDLFNRTFADFRQIFGETLQTDASELELDVDFSNYGIDSMVVLDVIDRLEAIFGELPKTLLFEHMTFRSLIDYFLNTHQTDLNKRYQAPSGSAQDPVSPATVTQQTIATASNSPAESIAIDMKDLKQRLTVFKNENLAHLEQLESGMSQVEHLGRGLLLKTLLSQNLFPQPGEVLSIEAFKSRLKLIPKYERLFGALLEMWQREGWIQYDKQQVQGCDAVTSQATQSRLEDLEQEQAEIRSQYADLVPFLNLVKVAVSHYPQVLAGEKTHLEVLFPKGSGELFENIYKGNGLSDFYNQLVIQAITTYLAEVRTREPARVVRILEIGSGTGGTSKGVLQAILPFADQLEYWYTDIGLGFVNFGKRSFAKDYPFAKFKVLDIEKDIQAQGFDGKGYDLVFETNCIHATRNLDQTTVEMKRLLKPNGLLIINEISRLQDFWTLVAGLIDGWWLFEDEGRIQHSPLLGYQGWSTLFEKHGFLDVIGADPDRVKCYEQAVVIAKSDGKVAIKIGEPTASIQTTAPSASNPNGSDDGIKGGLTNELRIIFAETLQISPEEIEPRSDFSEYGLDSMVTLDVLDRLEAIYAELPKTLLFEHMNLNSLVGYFMTNHLAQLNERFGTTQTQTKAPTPPSVAQMPPNETSATTPITPVSSPAGSDAFAIIGVSGRFPMAEDLDELWENLGQGKNCITEVPANRWDWRAYQGDLGQPGKAYTRWGGFLADFNCFDALFFKIAPRQAEQMDPQQRLFLQTVYATIEDAGYTRARLGGKVGVFAGVTSNTYGLHGMQQTMLGNTQTPDNDCYDIANRISYFFDFNGPSIALDSACSSSLTAVHLACDSMRRGDCEAAIAGGVSLTLHPNRIVQFCGKNMLSADGKSRTFGKDANGFVDAEGVGAILIKPLDRAIADGDRIHAVIKGSAINAGGRTSGYTVPNPNAQADVVATALKRAGLDANQISYVEAHGTGTSLGDPIEIAGLTNAFRQTTQAEDYCSLGSIKTNIGHTIAAAGIAGLTKVLLQMRHRTLVPSLHAEQTNPFIKFSRTPFRLQKELSPWVGITDEGQNQPLRAGISSFGAGGANAHVILESHPPQVIESDPGHPQLLILSAKDGDRLREYAQNLKKFVSRHLAAAGTKQIAAPSPVRLVDMAHTLRIGRVAFIHRLAILVPTLQALFEVLDSWLEGKREDRIFTGLADASNRDLIEDDEDGRTYIQSLIRKGKLGQIAKLWTRGSLIDWELLPQTSASIVSLPTYPFARERYWLPEAVNPSANMVLPGNPEHALIHRNTSNFYRQQFRSTFSGKEFFLNDHQIGGDKILPGVVALEMARYAGEIAGDQQVHQLRNMIWPAPLTIGSHPQQVHTQLHLDQNQLHASFEMTSTEGKVHARGEVRFGRIQTDQVAVDMARLRARLTVVEDSKTFYARFTDVGIDHGPSMRAVQTAYLGENEALVRLVLPDSAPSITEALRLHPSILDSALQAGTRLLLGTKSTSWMVYALDQLIIHGELANSCWAHARLNPSTGSELAMDIDLLDDMGNCLLRMIHFVAKPGPKKESGGKRQVESDQTPLTFVPDWEPAPLMATQPQASGPLLALVDNAQQGQAIREAEGDSCVLVMVGTHFQDLGGRTYRLNPTSLEDFRQLLTALDLLNHMPARVLHLWANHQNSSQPVDLRMTLDQGPYTWLLLNQAIREQQPDAKCCIIHLHLSQEGQIEPTSSALAAMGRTMVLENPQMHFKTVAVDQQSSVATWLPLVLAEFGDREQGHEQGQVHYRNGIREQACLRRCYLKPRATQLHASQAKTTYLIVGGTGGIGFHFARHFATRTGIQLVLSGRSRLSTEIQGKLDELQALGAQALYIQADVSHEREVASLIQKAKTRFGAIHGVIHAAGVNRDGFALKKTREAMAQVLAPKVFGTIHLDAFTKNEPLAFFALFSSLVVQVGNSGQCDYAYANGFLDSFAQNRKGPGQSLAINWPLWADGGMYLSDQTIADFEETLGMKALKVKEGLAAFELALQNDLSRLILVQGNQQKLLQILQPLPAKDLPFGDVTEKPVKIVPKIGFATQQGLMAPTPAATPLPPQGNPTLEEGAIRQQTQAFLTELLATEFKLPKERIKPHEPLEDYGIDSIMVVNLNRVLEAKFGRLSKTLFYEYQSLDDLTGYFFKRHRQTLSELFSNREQVKLAGFTEQMNPKPVHKTPVPRTRHLKNASTREPRNIADPEKVLDVTAIVATPTNRLSQDIAIIGMDGRFPQAPDLDAFWENLKQGVDCIREIPQDRWDHTPFFDRDKKAKGKTNSKWGGFIDQVDAFDARFFKIAPREAAIMDPQERLFLETAWHTLEHAGYPPKTLAEAKVGVYVGVMWGEYQLLGAEETLKGHPSAASSSFASIANRVSYTFNFRGPSLALDTMCSSSLTAIKLACDALRVGSLDVALVGGVNISIHPNKYLYLGQGQFAASSGRCKSFGEGGDGYVPGEGVGAVLLKPLQQAVADGDYIHGIIKGAVINHGGKTNGYTVPNPHAQGDAIADALRDANIPAQSIGYIEAHGTGTSLGDPIEITGLEKAFTQARLSPQSIPIGSVKSNVGHLESAAGICGLIKVLLQMKHRQLVPSIHSATLNPNIDFTHSPFYVQNKLVPWPQPQGHPRRAGISSFGAGGSNAHIIIEEYLHPAYHKPIDSAPQIIVVSARTEVALQQSTAALLAFLTRQDRSTINGPSREFNESIRTMMASQLGIPADELDLDTDLFETGFDHLSYTNLLGRIKQQLDLAMDPAQILTSGRQLAAWAWSKTSKARILSPDALSLPLIAQTLQTGREAIQERLAMVVADMSELITTLEALNSGAMPPNCRRGNTNLPSPSVQNEEQASDLLDLASQWVAGQAIDWRKIQVHPGPVKRLPLPTYPFARKRHWFPTTPASPTMTELPPVASVTPASAPSEPNPVQCLQGYWVDQELETLSKGPVPSILVFESHKGEWSSKLTPFFKGGIICVTQGSHFQQHGPDHFSMNHRLVNDFRQLVEALAIENSFPQAMLNFWIAKPFELSDLEAQLGLGFYTQLYLHQAMINTGITTPVRQLIVYPSQTDAPATEALAAFGRTLNQEHPQCHMQVLGISSDQAMHDLVCEFHAESDDHFIRYHQGVRQVWRYRQTQIPAAVVHPNPNGVVLISGGAGGLGLLIAKHLSAQATQLILCGRSELTPEKASIIQAMRDRGGLVTYLRADISDGDSVASLIETIGEKHGELKGVIHAASVLRDGWLRQKSGLDAATVLAPKLAGTVNLDAATQDLNLDFFMVCGSLASLMGNPGQVDYAFANRFQDCFIRWREHQQQAGLRHGRSIVIHWPLWQTGGMTLSPASQDRLKKQWGLLPLANDAGLQILDGLIAGSSGSLAVICGDAQRFTQALFPGTHDHQVYKR